MASPNCHPTATTTPSTPGPITLTIAAADVVPQALMRAALASLEPRGARLLPLHLQHDHRIGPALADRRDAALLLLTELVSNAVREMSEGELLQIEKARKLDISEEIYYDIIRQKTASLVAACCATGKPSSARAWPMSSSPDER